MIAVCLSATFCLSGPLICYLSPTYAELCHWLVGRDRGALLLLEAKTLASLRAFTLELPSPLPSAAASVVSALAVPTGGPISEDDFHGAEGELSPQLLCAGFGDGRIDCYDADNIKHFDKVPES